MEVDPAWMETDYYETLRVAPTAEPAEITRAYRRLARDLHPDTSPDLAATDRFAELRLPFVEAVQGTTTAVSVPGRGAVTVRVPPGVEDGQTLRVPGEHDPDPGGGAGPDLLVTVHVEAHRLFSRRGDDLVMTVPIAVTEAIRGAEVTVPTLENRPVTVRIPPGTPSGRTLRIPGRGVPNATGRGDLLVTVQIHVPTHLEENHRELIDQLARCEDPTALRAHLEVKP